MTITHITPRELALERENERNLEQLTDDLAQSRAELAAFKAHPVCGYDETTGNCTKNPCCRAASVQPEQQPRAYIAFSENSEHISYWTRSLEDAQTWTGRTNKKCEPFYPAPVQPAPLTDEQIRNLQAQYPTENDPMPFARAIETAIKGGAT